MRSITSLLVFICAAFGFAQMDLTDMMSMTSKPAFAIQRPDIKKELKLSKDQQKEISAIEKELQKDAKAGSAAGTQDFAAGMAVFGKFDEAGKKIVALLDETQQKRFFEIRVQMKGPPGITDPEIAKLLEITEEQTAKIKETRSRYLRSVMTGSKGIKAMEKARDAHDVELLALLTETQRTKLKEMEGKPFKNARYKGGY
jgi:hypothetical protein